MKADRTIWIMLEAFELASSWSMYRFLTAVSLRPEPCRPWAIDDEGYPDRLAQRKLKRSTPGHV
jgi:hypothetical protein